MALKVIKSFRLPIIRNRLKKVGSRDAWSFLSIVEYLFLNEVQELIGELDSKFDSTYGPRAYPRTLVIGVLMYALNKGRSSLSDISSFCEDSHLLNLFTSGFNPKDDLDFIVMSKQIARQNNNKNREKWNLQLKDGKKSSPKLFKEKIIKILQKGEIDEETEKALKLALKNTKIYCRKVYNNINELEKAIMKSNKDYVSVSFPDAVMMKTKKGKYDFALNLQSIMANHKILITGVLLQKPNDSSVLEEVLKELKVSFELLKELAQKYNNYGDLTKFEFENLIDYAIFICDAGYFSNDNIEIADFNDLDFIVMSKQIARQNNNNDLDFIVMSKQIARQNNNKNREKWNLQLKDGKKNMKKDNVSKKQCIRIKDAYVCPNEQLISLDSKKLINSKYNRQSHIVGDLQEYSFKFTCKDCTDCPFVKKYGVKCNCAEIEDRISMYMYKMTNEFAEGKYNEIYKDRFPTSECINGVHKTKNGILYLLCRDLTANQNEILFRGLLYNLKRINKLKETSS